MRSLILADIHANIDALEAVLALWDRLRLDDVFVLGDVVGYNGAPAAVIARLIELNTTVMIRGNHDKVCARLEPATSFHATARRAAEWTTRALAQDDLAWLAALPEGPHLGPVHERRVEVCHGAPFDEDFYVIDSVDARRALECASAPVCFNAHTHVPAVFRTEGFAVWHDQPLPETDDPTIIEWPVDGRLLVNVGSVGQPRDGDPRAAFGVWDADAGTIEMHRVPYDIDAAQRRIITGGLPVTLAARLAAGE